MVSVSRFAAAPHFGQVQFTKESILASGDCPSSPGSKSLTSGRRSGKFFFRNSYNTAVRAMDQRDRLTPVSLAVECPVFHLVLNACFTDALLLKFFQHTLDRIFFLGIAVEKFGVDPQSKIKSLSKGMREKVQIVLVMSRNAKLYLLDEPMGGVDPAARDYILRTIIENYNEDSTILITTHLISDIEKVLDDVVFIRDGGIFLNDSVDNIRTNYKKSVDELFREVFACC